MAVAETPASASRGGSSEAATTHAHFTAPELRQRRLTPAQLHRQGWWLLRAPNGHLDLATLAATPEAASVLAAAMLSAPRAETLPWGYWHEHGYDIVRPVGPYFREGRPDDCWGRQARRLLWETRVLPWQEQVPR
jgi:hypothetical protein